MTIDQMAKKFITNPSYLDMGAGKLSKQWDCDKEDIYEAKTKAREIINKAQAIKLDEEIKTENMTAKYVGSEKTEELVSKKYKTTRPLSPKEIEELAGVDGINTYVSKVLDKMATNGTWTYSIDVRYKTKDFYTTEELKDKLKDLMPDIKPVKLPDIKLFSEKALIVCLADDHVGAVNTTNIFNSPTLNYDERLTIILDEIRLLDQKFEELHIISLGDQMNGWNSMTTRGGHEVKSLSNKEQFDIYVEGRIKFYNGLFGSGVAKEYFIHDVENSNHSGMGMSYVANRCVEIYLDGKFPEVTRTSIHDAIDGFQYGQHIIGMGHGKDEKYQKKPMPAVLNPATDLYLYDFFQNKKYSPYDTTTTFYKGDLHQHGVQNGKFGRYVNVQAISGNSDYGDINFGNTRGGALLEIIHKDSYRIQSQPIWF